MIYYWASQDYKTHVFLMICMLLFQNTDTMYCQTR